MRDVKELAHLTNAYIAQEAEVSMKTIERIMAINVENDILRATARRIERVIIGQVENYTCFHDQEDRAAETIRRLQEEVAYWKRENDRKAKIIDKYLD